MVQPGCEKNSYEKHKIQILRRRSRDDSKGNIKIITKEGRRRKEEGRREGEKRKKSGRNDCTLCSKEKKKAAELRRDSLQSLLSVFSRH